MASILPCSLALAVPAAAQTSHPYVFSLLPCRASHRLDCTTSHADSPFLPLFSSFVGAFVVAYVSKMMAQMGNQAGANLGSDDADLDGDSDDEPPPLEDTETDK